MKYNASFYTIELSVREVALIGAGGEMHKGLTYLYIFELKEAETADTLLFLLNCNRSLYKEE